MTSLRTRLAIGALFWSIGLLSATTILITLHPELAYPVSRVHQHGVIAALIAIGAMVAGLGLVRAALAPLERMRRRLGDVQNGSERRLDGTYPAEVQPLVDDLNALLEHRDRAVRRAIAKAGDLAHARAAASGTSSGARCSVAVSADGLSRTMLRLHAERGLTIDVRVPGDHDVRCQREDLDEMLGNLLDNACKWARSRVTLSSSPDGGGIAVVVDDDGPGIDPALHDAVLQRGVRADEAAPGSGLGLAIVRDLAEVYGGSIALDRSPMGGLRARLHLPRA